MSCRCLRCNPHSEVRSVTFLPPFLPPGVRTLDGRKCSLITLPHQSIHVIHCPCDSFSSTSSTVNSTRNVLVFPNPIPELPSSPISDSFRHLCTLSYDKHTLIFLKTQWPFLSWNTLPCVQSSTSTFLYVHSDPVLLGTNGTTLEPEIEYMLLFGDFPKLFLLFFQFKYKVDGSDEIVVTPVTWPLPVLTTVQVYHDVTVSPEPLNSLSFLCRSDWRSRYRSHWLSSIKSLLYSSPTSYGRDLRIGDVVVYRGYPTIQVQITSPLPLPDLCPEPHTYSSYSFSGVLHYFPTSSFGPFIVVNSPIVFLFLGTLQFLLLF